MPSNPSWQCAGKQQLMILPKELSWHHKRSNILAPAYPSFFFKEENGQSSLVKIRALFQEFLKRAFSQRSQIFFEVAFKFLWFKSSNACQQPIKTISWDRRNQIRLNKETIVIVLLTSLTSTLYYWVAPSVRNSLISGVLYLAFSYVWGWETDLEG